MWCLYSIILLKSTHVAIPIALGPLADSSIILSEGPYANIESHILHCISGMIVELCSGCGWTSVIMWRMAFVLEGWPECGFAKSHVVGGLKLLLLLLLLLRYCLESRCGILRHFCWWIFVVVSEDRIVPPSSGAGSPRTAGGSYSASIFRCWQSKDCWRIV